MRATCTGSELPAQWKFESTSLWGEDGTAHVCKPVIPNRRNRRPCDSCVTLNRISGAAAADQPQPLNPSPPASIIF